MELNETSKEHQENGTSDRRPRLRSAISSKLKDVNVSRREFGRNAFRYFQNFSENASIDGLKFLGEEGRCRIERIFWSIMVSISFILCVIMVYQAFVKWWNFPVVVTFATSPTFISQIPFPAVTICPQVKADKNYFNYTDYYVRMENGEKLNDSERLNLDVMSLVCSPDEIYDKNAKFIDNDALDFLAEIAPSIDDVILEMVWRGHEIENVSSYFVPIITGEGVCFTFNALDKSEIFTERVEFPSGIYSSNGQRSQWSLERGYDKDEDIEAYPRKTVVAGIKGGLSITLMTPKSSIDYVCGDFVQGFKVAFHNPFEIPRPKQNYLPVPLDQTVVAAVKPQILTTSGDLRRYSPKDRDCYFENEKQLCYFKMYNQRNCMLECLSNYTFNTCGCVAFNMPQNVTTPICSIATYECIQMAKVRFLKDEVDKIKAKNKNTDACGCLPSCYSLDFDVETSQANWDWTEEAKIAFEIGEIDEEVKNILIGEEGLHISMLQVYFKEMQFITSERNELYGHVDFWANVGGIIGLFTGFSFITMFEIIYYLSLRLICNVKMYGKKYWFGVPEENEEKSNV